MMMYFVKFIACSGLLLAVYHLLLKNKAMYRFNRIFLLAGIVFSLAVPFIQFEQHVVNLPQIIPVAEPIAVQPEQPVFSAENYQELTTGNNTTVSAPAVVSAAPVSKPVNYLLIIGLSVYGIVTGLLLFRFIRNLYKISQMAALNEHVDYNEAELVLIPQRFTPHSFFKYIFLNRDDFTQHKVEDKILHHELAHTRQHHSADVVFIELVQVFCWFNPLLILYRKSIQLNHEFLADEAVLNSDADVYAYQYTLLNSLRAASGLSMASQFSYALTKKRLLMMTRKTSRRVSILSRLGTLIIVGFVFIVFCNATSIKKAVSKNNPIKHSTMSANDTSKAVQNKTVRFPPPIFPYFHTKKGLSKDALDQYASIVAKYPIERYKISWKLKGHITSADSTKLEQMYRQMSLAQQFQQTICFTKNEAPRDMIAVTDEQLQTYKDKAVYDVWINYKRVDNIELDKYKAVDLVIMSAGKKLNKAITHTKYSYHVSLFTNDFYQDYRKNALANLNKSYIIIRYQSPAEKQLPVSNVSHTEDGSVTYAKGEPFVPVIAPLPKETSKIRFPKPYPSTKEGVSQQMLDEYQTIIGKYENTWGSIPPRERKWEDKDRARLIAIYRQMSLEQQAKQVIIFHYGYPLQSSVKPTQAQLNAFANEHVYGVWIDEKKVPNNEISKYTPADFGDVAISTLTPRAINYKRYRYEVILSTVKYNEVSRKSFKGDEFKDHMWIKVSKMPGVRGFKVKDDQYQGKKNASVIKFLNDRSSVNNRKPNTGVSPTAVELAAYQNDNYFWVYVNGKRIWNNAALSNYKPQELVRAYDKNLSQSGDLIAGYTNVVQFTTIADKQNLVSAASR